MDQGVGYGWGKLADVYRPRRDGPAPLALLWHGVEPDERGALAARGTAVARRGVAAVVPDWRSDEPDGGRAHLLASLDFARELARQRPAEFAAADGWPPSGAVCLAGGSTRRHRSARPGGA